MNRNQRIKTGRMLIERRVVLSLYEIDLLKTAIRAMLVRTHGFGGEYSKLMKKLEEATETSHVE